MLLRLPLTLRRETEYSWTRYPWLYGFPMSTLCVDSSRAVLLRDLIAATMSQMWNARAPSVGAPGVILWRG